MIAVGNEKQVCYESSDRDAPRRRQISMKQFKLLANQVLKMPELSDDLRFSSNDVRVANRTELVRIMSDVFGEHPRNYWLEKLTGLGYVLIFEFYWARSHNTIAYRLGPSTTFSKHSSTLRYNIRAEHRELN